MTILRYFWLAALALAACASPNAAASA